MEAVEIASIHGVFMHVAEKIAGCSKRLGEYPTLSAIRSAQIAVFPGKLVLSAVGTQCDCSISVDVATPSKSEVCRAF